MTCTCDVNSDLPSGVPGGAGSAADCGGVGGGIALCTGPGGLPVGNSNNTRGNTGSLHVYVNVHKHSIQSCILLYIQYLVPAADSWWQIICRADL